MDIFRIMMESAVFLYILKEAVLFIKARREEKRCNGTFKRAFIDISKLYEELNFLLAKTAAKRVLVLRAHNGGGKPKKGYPLYSTAEYEVYQGSGNTIKQDWQKQPLDEYYISMLTELDQQEQLELKLFGMDDESMIKKLYFNDGIFSAKLLKIHETKDSFFYLSVQYGREVDFLDMNFDELSRPHINRIKQLFNDGK